jgi:F-type H+-transporting ATPase subunit delta
MERLSNLYASALFELAMERGAVNEFLDQAITLRDTLKDAECIRVLVHPHITAAEKQEFFTKAFAGHIHEDLLGFLFLVTEKNREIFLIPALTALIGLIERYNNKVTAKVFFASAPEEGHLAEMKELLSRKLKKTVEISLKVDPSVIGGPYIYVDGYYIDWTVKTRLRDLTIHMKEGCSA